jgi:hypothetical protein
MKIAIMQPYFFPYIGYWQLLKSVDKFVIYDNIQFTKKGWIHRNRILINGIDKMFTLPLKKDSDFFNINERYLSDDSKKQIIKTLRIIKNSYSKAPFFQTVYPVIENIFLYDNKNLFEYIINSINIVKKYLNIETDIIISSSIDIDHKTLKGKNKVLAICDRLSTKTYINAIGGKDLYNVNEFKKNGIELKFLQTNNINYKQFKNEFVPNLSIIDIMMFNPVSDIKEMLNLYKLI